MDTASRAGSSTRQRASTMSRDSDMTTKMNRRSSAVGPRLNSLIVPCSCIFYRACLETRPATWGLSTLKNAKPPAAKPGHAASIVNENAAQPFEMLERLAAAAHHAGERVVGGHHGQAG